VDPLLSPVALADARDERLFGGKAVSLGVAAREGLPVPPGMAIAASLVDAIAAGDPAAARAVMESPYLPNGPVAVRSSAVGEDSAIASFAGQHATHLNVAPHQLLEAIRAVWESGRTDAARAYRARRGMDATPAVGVVVQQLVDPIAAGVLFTRNPITGADERIIESAWGLGEIVVSSRVVPDYFRLAVDGTLLECTIGDKDTRIVRQPDGGTRDEAVPDDLRRAPSLRVEQLRALCALADRCRAVWRVELDLEFAVTADALYLLQSRPITTGMPQAS
jgi:pyruvate,water dikinase